MDYRIATFNNIHYRIKIAELTGHVLFVRRGGTDVIPVGKPYRCRQWRQTLA
jgi:hypothetical protein